MIKKLAKDTEEHLELKLSKDIYDKDKGKIHQKLSFLSEAMVEKAEKNQVKKGLTFLQDKIKQIIIVVADQRGNTQDGALKKMPYKCLSCDKELEAERG